MKQAASTIVLLTVFLTAGVAFAEEAFVQQAWWQLLIVHLIEIVVTIFVPVLSFLVWKITKRWGINAELVTVNTILEKSIGFAEQKAKNALKDDKKPTPSAEKLDMALEFGRSLASRYNLEKWATEKLNDLIEAKLGEK